MKPPVAFETSLEIESPCAVTRDLTFRDEPRTVQRQNATDSATAPSRCSAHRVQTLFSTADGADEQTNVETRTLLLARQHSRSRESLLRFCPARPAVTQRCFQNPRILAAPTPSPALRHMTSCVLNWQSVNPAAVSMGSYTLPLGDAKERSLRHIVERVVGLHRA